MIVTHTWLYPEIETIPIFATPPYALLTFVTGAARRPEVPPGASMASLLDVRVC